MGIALIFAMYAVWSSIYSLGRIALDCSPPVFLTASRMLLAGVLLIGFLAIKRPRLLKVNKRSFLSICALAFLGVYLTNVLELWGLSYIAPAKVSLIYSLTPFFAAILSYIHFNEKMTAQKLIGMIVGFCGLLPILLAKNESEDVLRAFTFFSWPELAVIGAVFFAAYGWIFLRSVVKEDISSLCANGYAMLIGGTLALTHSLIFDSWQPIPVADGKLFPFFQGVILMTLISNILCYNLYGYLLKKFTVTFLTLVGLSSPIFASINDWILRGEPLSWTVFLSTGIISIGLFLVYQTELRQGYIARKEKKLAKQQANA
ncbi:MAG: DMT family transporter [Chlamydiota bacterium]